MKRLQRAWAAWLALPEVARLGLIIAVVIVAVLLWPRSAHAGDLVARNGPDVVRLSDKPCSSEIVLVIMNQRYRDEMRDASATVGGQPFRACWLVDRDDAHLLYEDGDQGLIPLADFKPEVGS